MPYEKDKHEFFQLGGRNTKASPYDNGPADMREIVNLNFTTFGALTQRPGSSLYSGATVLGMITGGVEFQRLSGASYLVITANTNAFSLVPGTYTSFKSGLLNNALFSFVTFVDRLFAANGNDYFKWDGSNTTNVGLPAGLTGVGIGPSAGGSLTNGVTTTFIAGYGYINDRNYIGPAYGVTVVLDGTTNNSISFSGVSFPPGYGITAIQFYRSSANGIVLFGTTTLPSSLAAIGSTYTDTSWPITLLVQTNAVQFTLVPRFLEIYNNQLFMAGFSAFLSTAYWSEVGNPEAVDPQSFIEFRTNDGDQIRGMKSYYGSLVIAKQRSTHLLTGTDPTNFLVSQLTDQYGCLSHRAMVCFNSIIWFLDTKGICQFDGAQVQIISTKVEDIFKTMNIPVAIDTATAFHYRELNEVWFAIPTGTSTVNDTIVVFDYVAQQWTVYKGVNPAILFPAKQLFNVKLPFFGTYSGAVYYMSATLLSDSGNGITCMFRTRFDAPQGQSTERMFRRLFVNVEPVLGFTQPIQVNLYTNYQPAIQSTQTMFANPFQSRVDFGLSARSIQAQLIAVSASFPMKFYGYAWESRFQRPV